MDTHIIITQRGPILVYAKIPLTIGPSSAAEPSPHAISSAACTTNIVGYSFRKGQRDHSLLDPEVRPVLRTESPTVPGQAHRPLAPGRNGREDRRQADVAVARRR